MNKNLGLLFILLYYSVELDAGISPYQLPNQYQYQSMRPASNIQENFGLNSMRSNLPNGMNYGYGNGQFNGKGNFNNVNENANPYRANADNMNYYNYGNGNGVNFNQNKNKNPKKSSSSWFGGLFGSSQKSNERNQTQFQAPTVYSQPPKTGLLDWFSPEKTAINNQFQSRSKYKNHCNQREKPSGLIDFVGNMFGPQRSMRNRDLGDQYNELDQNNMFRNRNRFNNSGNLDQDQDSNQDVNESYNNLYNGQMRPSMPFNASMDLENEAIDMMPTNQYVRNSGSLNNPNMQARNSRMQMLNDRQQNIPNSQYNGNNSQMESTADLQTEIPSSNSNESNFNLNRDVAQESNIDPQLNDPEWNKLKIEKVIIIKRVKVPVSVPVPVPMPYPVPSSAMESVAVNSSLKGGAGPSSISNFATVQPGYLGKNTYMVEGSNNTEPLQINNLLKTVSSPESGMMYRMPNYNTNMPMMGTFNPKINTNLPYPAPIYTQQTNAPLNPILSQLNMPMMISNPITANLPLTNPIVPSMPMSNPMISNMPMANPMIPNMPMANPMLMNMPNNYMIPRMNPIMAQTMMQPGLQIYPYPSPSPYPYPNLNGDDEDEDDYPDTITKPSVQNRNSNNAKKGLLMPKQFTSQQIQRALPNATQLQTISAQQIPVQSARIIQTMPSI